MRQIWTLYNDQVITTSKRLITKYHIGTKWKSMNIYKATAKKAWGKILATTQ